MSRVGVWFEWLSTRPKVWLTRSGTVRLVAELLSLAVIVGTLWTFWRDYEDRTEERKNRAWTLIAAAKENTGNIGLVDALHTLKNYEVTDLTRLTLPGAYLRKVELAGFKLDNANLQGADLVLANLEGANLYEANLKGVVLFGAKLKGARLDWADLSNADLSFANLAGSHSFETAELAGTDYVFAELTGTLPGYKPATARRVTGTMNTPNPITKPSLHTFTGLLVAVLVLLIPVPPAWAEQVRIAVAANFTAAAKEIGVLFEQATEHEAGYSFGSTGQLYAQITQGAPFEVFLAADQARPAQAVAAGLAVADSRFTYATGRLVLFSRDESLVTDETTLRNPGITKVAIANPVTAPYGAAAVAVMQALGVYAGLAPRLVRGSNIAQTYQFVATGNAEIGFVALSQIARHDNGSRWPVPDALHPALAQDAVMLRRGAGNRAAQAFMAFLKSSGTTVVKMRYGYD